MKLSLLICIAGLSTSCSQQEVDFTIDINYLETAQQRDLPEIASDDLKLSMTAGDYLPTGWEYNGDERFFEVEKRAIKGGWVSIYYQTIKEEVIDIRVATYIDDALVYNLPVWSYSNNQSDYTRIRKTKGQYTIEMYNNGQVLHTYYPEQGKLVFNDQ
ncbi:MAG: hypothetical protein AAFP77_12935 [Bacteroidota bacterium]